ncbi:PKD domain-containing protein [Flavobacterium sp. RSSA_27]|uniref:PKD domain-containing protein n=1 Tax=Flavobacterium sp. RSSA_27 TaxID=3447667 RepID=UPI003F38C81E
MNSCIKKFIGVIFLLVLNSLHAQNCTVNANIAQTICSNETLTLVGNANGDANFVLKGWTQLSGPTVNILTPSQLVTNVVGFLPGNKYVFRLTGICSDGATVNDDVTITVNPITIANAGSDFTSCKGTYLLNATTPGVGERGEWSIIGANNAGVQLNDTTLPNATYLISGTSAGSTTLRWTIFNPILGCTSSDDVIITSFGGISPVSAGPDEVLSKCYSSTQKTSLSGSFAGNGLGGQQGTWTVINGPSVPTFSNSNSNTCTVSNLKEGVYVFRWTVVGSCVSGFDEVQITVPPPTADVTPLEGKTINYCDQTTSALLVGKIPLYNNEVASWVQLSGPSQATITSPNTSSTNVTNLISTGTYVFQYTISNTVTGCTSSANYNLVFADTPTLNLGPDISLECNSTEVNIPIQQTGNGTTSWRIINGPANPNFPVYPTNPVNFTGNVLTIDGLIKDGSYDIRVVKSIPEGNACSTVSATIKVVVSSEPSGVNPGTPQVLECSSTTAVLAGNIPEFGIGKWTQASGPTTAIIADPFAAATEVSGMTNGLYTFQWNIFGGPQCIVSTGIARILVSNVKPNLPNAGPDQTVCFSSPVQLNATLPLANEKGVWTIVSSTGSNFNISDLENPSAIFTGNDPNAQYTLRWTVSNSCDVSFDEITITTTNALGPIQSNAGQDACFPSGTKTFLLSGNDPSPGVGIWKQISGPNVIIDNPSIFNTSISGVIDGNYVFRWEVSSGGCSPSIDDVAIAIAPNVSTSIAGANQIICNSSTTMNANTPVVGNGEWSLVSANPDILIRDKFNPNTIVENIPVGTWVFAWTITNNGCGTSVSNMQITVEEKPSVAFAGNDQEICDNSPLIMRANNPRVGLGTWNLVSGPNVPIYSDFNSPTTVIENIISGTYVFKWTVSNGLCPDNFDTVKVVVRDYAKAGEDILSCDVGVIPLVGTIGTVGTWSYVGGTINPTLTITGGNSASISNLSKGIATFRYTIPAVGNCPASSDDVQVLIVSEPTLSDAGSDQNLCDATQFQLDGNVPFSGKGKWEILSGPATGTFLPNATDPKAIYSNASPGVYVFQWVITDFGCNSTDQVRIENNQSPTNPNAGPDQLQVCGNSTTLGANPPSVGVGAWRQVSGPSTASFSSLILPNPTVSNLVPGIYVFEWSISNGTICPIERDQVVITVFENPTQPDAGPNQQVCGNLPFVQLNANSITKGTGTWSISNGPNGSFANSNDPKTLFTPSGPGSYTLVWQAATPTCQLLDTVEIVVDAIPTVADAGPEISICKGTPLFMKANTPIVGEGRWTSKGGPSNPVFLNPNSPTTQVVGLEVGEYNFVWEISNGSCLPSIDLLRVIIEPEATIASAGLKQTICNTDTAVMNGNTPLEGIGQWSFVSNPNGAIITNPNDPTTTVTGLNVGINRLRWTISNACGSNFIEVNIERLSDLVTTPLNNETICLGGTATFTTTTSGSQSPYSYQWQSSTDNVNWIPISGANTSQYTTANTLNLGNYFYRVEVSNSCTTIYSNAASLTVVNDPVVTTQPIGTTICSGNTHTMNVVATGGTGVLLYQWQESNDGTSFTPIAGANGSSYTTTALNSNKYYRVRVTQAASGCEVFSTAAIVYVTTITTQPSTPADICVGGTASMSVDASLNGGSGSISFQWQSSPDGTSSWTDVNTGSGFTSTTFTTENLTNSTWYRCKITSSTIPCQLFSSSVKVTVVPDPSITVQPIGEVICIGGNHTLSVTATGGTPGLKYQWQSSSTSGSGFVDIAGANSSSYTTGNFNSIQTIYYQVVISADGNGCNSITSSEAIVTVVPDPVVTDQPDDITICDATSTTLNVVATGDSSTGALRYQWQSSATSSSGFSNIAGATSDSYTTPILTTDTFYRVVITQAPSGCRVVSNEAKVSVAKIAVQPTTPVAICVGGIISVAVTTTVVPGTTYAYQWQSSADGTIWNNELNASATTANFTSDALNATTQFRCIVTTINPSCTLTSSVVSATVVPDPTIDTPPVGGTICIGGNFNLNVLASNGTPSLTYQWQSSTTSGSGFTDIVGAVNSSLNVTSLSQTTYYRVSVSAAGNGCTTITSNEAMVTVIPDPIIVTQPVANTTICKNSSTTLSVVASGGSGTFSYQWQSATSLGGNYTDILGATSATFSTANLSATTYFRVLVFNSGSGCNTLTSNEAIVFVGDIITQPVAPAAPICDGGVATISLIASANGGTATFTYQWEASLDGISAWTSIPSATSNSFTTPALSTSTFYRCIVTSSNPTCTIISDVVKIEVVPDPIITTQPLDGFVCSGGAYDLNVVATNGSPFLTYQWQSSTSINGPYSDITGATSANYTTLSLLTTTYFRVVVSASANGCTTVISNPATVAVIPDPIITAQPLDGAICVGNNYTFTVSATGDPVLGGITYQWQIADALTGPFTNVVNGIGGTTNNYTTPTFTTTTPRYYRALVKQNASGCETFSNVVVLTISALPSRPIGNVVQQPNCSFATGTIKINSPAENSGFEYSINGGSSYQNSSVFSNLSSGVKTITVRKIGATTCVSLGTDFTINNRLCANSEVFASINGALGGATTSVLGTDTLQGAAVTLNQVTLTKNSTSSPNIELNPTSGIITVAPGTPAGTYTVIYTICERANPSNCSTVTESVVVLQSPIDAVSDIVNPNVNGFEGQLSVINVLSNDKLNGLITNVSQVTVTTITPAIPIGGAPIPVLNPITGNIDVPSGTPANNYSIEYEICEKLNPNNCDKATVFIPVVAPIIEATNDTSIAINGFVGNTNVLNVLSNDLLNNKAVLPNDIVVTVVTAATPIRPGALIPVLDVTTGVVSVPMGTPIGTYTLSYRICDKLNPSNCDTASVTVIVSATTLVANDDDLGPVNGYVGAINVINAYTVNDTYNGSVVDLSLVTPTLLNAAIPVRPGALVPVLDVATGNVTIPVGTPADDYAIQYQLCENLNPTNCDVALINIRVAAAPLVANDDNSISVNGKIGSPQLLNAYTNDTFNGNSLSLSELTKVIITPAVPILGGPVPTLDLATGIVSVPPNTPAGRYTITYRLCENLNPQNCDPATIVVNVDPSPIEANDNFVLINGFTGGNNVLLVLSNDKLLGVQPALSDVAISLVKGAVPINGGQIPILNPSTGFVSVPAGTPAGDYVIEYKICEKLNLTNCDSAFITITVLPTSIDAINDAFTSINGVIGEANIGNVFTNDVLNGGQLNPNQVVLNVIQPAQSNGGAVPILDTSNGSVNIVPGTPIGNYFIEYEICERLNPSNCDRAIVRIGVNSLQGPLSIRAVNDNVTNVNGYVGAQGILNVLANDINSNLPANLSNVNLTVVRAASSNNVGTVPVLDATTGLVNVPANTPAGGYTIIYSICQKLNPSVCDLATVSIEVLAPTIEAFDDLISGVNGQLGQPNAINVLNNDLLAGAKVKLNEIIISEVVPANAIDGNAIPYLDTASGAITIPPGTAAGEYTIEYSICEILNPDSCAYATVTVQVVSSTIQANDDIITSVNGLIGATEILDVLSNDKINAINATINLATITVKVPAVAINGGLVPILNEASGKVTIPAGTSSGTYTIEYELCEKLNPLNCDSGIVSITVVAPSIVANDDLISNVNGFDGTSNVLDVLQNDTLNGVLTDISSVNVSVQTSAIAINGGAIPYLDTTTGFINVPQGTSAGTYFIQYSICDKLNPSNCDKALVTINVSLPRIIVNADNVTQINGFEGNSNAINALTNDQINTQPIDPSKVRITVVSNPTSLGGAVPILDRATGIVSVSPQTPAGTYVIGYQVCELLNPSNCDASKITIEVIPAEINAVDNIVTGINGFIGANDVIEATANDLLNGSKVDVSAIVISLVAPAISLGGNVPVLDTTTGLISVPAGTSAGSYTITYKICEKLNPTNCDVATITIQVIETDIIAVEDRVEGINGSLGATNVINALTNDILNGAALSLSDVLLTVVNPAAPLAGGLVPVLDVTNGFVNVPQNTPEGEYVIVYRICDKLNPANCSENEISIQVIAGTIIANNDEITGVDGFVGVVDAIDVLTNDTLNGTTATLTNIILNEVLPATSASGGKVPFLDLATGKVTIPPGTKQGGYLIVYQICEKLNPLNCSIASVKIVVGLSNIVANADAVFDVNGYQGETNVLNVLSNDFLSNLPADNNDVAIVVINPAQSINGAPVPILDVNSGWISVPAGTPSRDYFIVYGINEKLNQSVSDVSYALISVNAAPLDINEDIPLLPVIGNSGNPSVINAFENDTFNGLSLNLNELNVSVVREAGSTTSNTPFPKLDTTTGIVSVPAGTPSGIYTITYAVCEKLNPNNCGLGLIQIKVVDAPIQANDDLTRVINGFDGANNVLNILTNDKLNAIPIAITDVNLQIIQSAVPINGGQVPFIDPNSGSVSVPKGTAAGIYQMQYEICEKLNPTNCAKANIFVLVKAPIIEANNDFLINVNSFVGDLGSLNVLTNDKINGLAVVRSDVVIKIINPAISINGRQVPYIDGNGKLIVPPSTPSGFYRIDYSICEKLNPSNCDVASVDVVVNPPIIDAINDTTPVVIGTNGKNTVMNALKNDRLNGVSLNNSMVKISVIKKAKPLYVGAPVPYLDVSNGNISVPSGTPAETYSIEYQICENLNASNCDVATIQIKVTAAPIIAVDDFEGPINGLIGNNSVMNAFANDTFNGSAITQKLVNVSIINPASPRFTGANVPSLDSTTGIVSVPADTPIGVYTIVYKLCERLNPLNCAEAIVRLQVTAAAVDAVDDEVVGINGFIGNPNAINAFANDTYNGFPLELNKLTIRIIEPALPIRNRLEPKLNINDGTVSVPAGTAAGNYVIVYQICEKLNPTNCDIASVKINVTTTSIDAVDDVYQIVNGNDGATSVLNVLNNDQYNNGNATLNDVRIVSIPSGPITINSDGSVNVAPNTPSGTYTLNYAICSLLNPSNCDLAKVTVLVQVPNVKLIKKGVFVDGNGDGIPQVGEKINYSFTITNTGTMTLTNLQLTDPKVTITGAPIASLQAGESNVSNFNATYILKQADIDAGKVINQATITVQPIVGSLRTFLSDSDDVSLTGDTDPTVTPLLPSKQITLIKKGVVQGIGVVGDTIKYSFELRNSGTVSLTNVAIIDPMLSASPLGVTPSTLLPGQVGTLEVVYTITAKDYALGEVINTAIGQGDAPDGTLVTDISDSDNLTATGPDDPTIVQLIAQPKIALIKTATFDDNNNDGKADVGETVTYLFSITNNGNVPLSNVFIEDDKPGIRIQGSPITMAVGTTDTNTFRAVYVLTSEDIKAGFVENQAKVKGTTSQGLTIEDLSDPVSFTSDNPTLINFDSCRLEIFNAISPNGDGINEYFKINGVECYQNVNVEIFDRWGVLVYSGLNYDNNTVKFVGISEGRSTLKKGSRLPDGTYYYVIKYQNYRGNTIQKVGYLFISY